jgi:hypothetical protein
MKCFIHLSNDSVGICKSCHRGVCAECAADCEGRLACKGRCEEKVHSLNRIESFSNKMVTRKANPVQFVYIGCGIMFIALGMHFYFDLSYWSLPICFIAMGLLFVLGGIRYYNSFKK